MRYKEITLILVTIILLTSVANAEICYCNSCESCSEALNDKNCNEVRLTSDILVYSGDCIAKLENFNNKVFDCQWHSIRGEEKGLAITGIFLYNNEKNTIKNCVFEGLWSGIVLYYSSYNSLINITTRNNRWCGIDLYNSPYNILRNTRINENNRSFCISGNELLHFLNDIDASNLVNDRPIYYWTAENNAPNRCRDAEVPQDAGFLALISCENITATNLNLSKNSHGILLVNTNNSRILNVHTELNKYGIYMIESSNNIILNFSGFENYYGIYLYYSNDNIISNLSVLGGLEGIDLFYSESNNISDIRSCYNIDYDIYEFPTLNNWKASIYTISNIDREDHFNKIGDCHYEICYCSDCEDCENKLKSRYCREVRLVNDITDYSKVCIYLVDDYNMKSKNKIFDCQGHIIEGALFKKSSDSIIKGYCAIFVRGINNLTIRNCIIREYFTGISLHYSKNIILFNNTIERAMVAIYLYKSVDNFLINNRLRKNFYYDFCSENESIQNKVENLDIGFNISFMGKDICLIRTFAPKSNPIGYLDIGKYINITNMSCDSWISLEINYDDNEIRLVNESTLELWKYDGSWHPINYSYVDTEKNYIYGNINVNLTGFGVFAPIGKVAYSNLLSPLIIMIILPLSIFLIYFLIRKRRKKY